MTTLNSRVTVSGPDRVSTGVQADRPSGRRIAPWLAAAAAFLGVLVLVGWFLQIPALRSVLPGLATMKVNTAFGLVGLGAAVSIVSICGPGGRARRVAAILAAAVTALAIATLLEYVLGVSFGIDELLQRDDDTRLLAPFPGRMAISTITAFTLGSGAMFAWLAGRRRVAGALAVAQLSLAWLSLLGYLFGSHEIGGLGLGTQMALHTAAGHALIAVALLIGPVAGGIMVFSRPTIGGSAARRLALASVGLLTLLATLRLAGERAGLFEVGLGLTLMTGASTVGLVMIAAWIGRSLDRLTAERDAASAELAAMFARYRAASEASLDAFYLLSAVRDERGRVVDFVFIDVNPRGAARMGKTPESVRGRTLSDLAVGDNFARFVVSYSSVVESGATREEEVPVTGVAGISWVRHQVMKVGDGVGVTSRDVSEAVQARDALAALNAKLAERNADLHDFTSVVSHDIRAPLRRIQMYGEQLEMDAGVRLGDDLPLLQRMRAGAAKLEKLVEELLAYARVEGSDRPRVEVDLDALLAEVIEDLQMPLREAGATVEVATLPVTHGEPILLRQLFTNLIANAIKFRRPDVASRIMVTGAIVSGPANREETEIIVRDNGIGFEQQYAERIFRIFERLHAEREFPGTGVGLAICRKIALYHDGTIEAAGIPGEGATFTIRLPRSGDGGER